LQNFKACPGAFFVSFYKMSVKIWWTDYKLNTNGQFNEENYEGFVFLKDSEVCNLQQIVGTPAS